MDNAVMVLGAAIAFGVGVLSGRVLAGMATPRRILSHRRAMLEGADRLSLAQHHAQMLVIAMRELPTRYWVLAHPRTNDVHIVDDTYLRKPTGEHFNAFVNAAQPKDKAAPTEPKA